MALLMLLLPIWLLLACAIAIKFMTFDKYIDYIEKKENENFVEKFLERKRKSYKIVLWISLFAFVIPYPYFTSIVLQGGRSTSLLEASFFSFTVFLMVQMYGVHRITLDIFWPKARHWAKLED